MMKKSLPILFSLFFATPAFAQNVTLQLDDNSFEGMWSLTSPQAGPGDWIGVAYDAPFEFPFRVTRATMYFLDEFCCPLATCNQACGDATLNDWEARAITPANLAVDAGGLTPDLASPIISEVGVVFLGPGSAQRSVFTNLTPDQWNMPAGTIFDHPGRIFYVIKYFTNDTFMDFAVDETNPLGTGGTSIFTNDSFATRASIWTIGDVGMRVDAEPIFFLKSAASNPTPTFRVASETNVTMLSVRVRGGNAATTVNTVRVTASGTGNDATGVSAVRLVVDADQDGVADAGEPTIATGSFTVNNGSVVLSPNRILPLGTTEEWLVVYDFSAAPIGAQTFAASIAQASDVTSSLGAPYVSGTVNGTGGLTGGAVTIAGSLSVSLGTSTMPQSVVPSGAQNVATLQLAVTSDNEQFTLSSLAFTASGTLNDVTQIQNVTLHRDADDDGQLSAGDVALGTPQTFTQNDGRIVFDFAGTPVTIAAGQTERFVVVYDLAAGGTGGDTFRTIFASPADITATGLASGAVPATGPRALTGTPVIGNEGTIGGALTAALGAANPPARTAQPSSIDNPMLQVALSAQAEAVDVDLLTFAAAGTGDETTHVQRVRLWRDVNANGTVDGTDVQLGLPQTFATNDGIVTFSIAGESIPPAATRNYLVTYDFTATPTGGETFRLRLNAAGDITAAGGASGAPIVAQGTFPLNGTDLTTLGGLSIMAGPENPPMRNVQPGSTDVPVLQLSVGAQGEDFSISTLRLTAAGSMLDDAGVTQVRVLRDAAPFGVVGAGDQLLGTSTFAVDDGVALFTFNPALAVTAGTTERWLVVYDLSLLSTPGQTFRVSIANATDVVASGSLSGNVNASGLPLDGNVHAIGGTLTVAAGTSNPAGGTITPNAANVVMVQARLTAVLEPVTVTAATFTANGTGNETTAIQAATLWVDTNDNGVLEPIGDLLLGAAQTFAQNDGTVTFTFAGRTIPAGSSESWIVTYVLTGQAVAGDTFGLSLAANTDVTATVPSGPFPRLNGAPVAGGERTVLGELTIARGAQTPAATTVARDATDVPVLQLSLTGVGETFAVGSIDLVAAGSVDDLGDIVGATLLRDVDGSGTRTAGDTVLAGPVVFSGDDGIVSFATPTLNVAAGATVDVLVVVDLAGTAAGGTTLRLNLPAAANLGVTGFGGRLVSAVNGLPLGSNTITVGGTLDVRLGNASPIARVVRQNEAGIGALQLRLVADTEPVTVTSVTLHASGSGNDATGIANVELFLDGDGDGTVGPGEPSLGTGTFGADDGSVTFNLTQVVQVGPAVHLLARVTMSNSPVGGETFRLGLDPTADVAITSGTAAVVVSGVAVDGALLTAGGGFTVALGGSSNTGGTVNQSQQNAAVLQLDLTAVNEACTVDALTLRAVGSIHDASDVAAVRLMRDVNDNGVVDFSDVQIGAAQTFTEDDGTVTFTGLARMLGTNASERWLVVYDLSGQASNLETFSVRFEDDTDLTVSCAVSGPVIPTGAPIDSASFTIQEDGALVVARGDNSPPDLFLAEGTVRAAVLQIRVTSTVQPLTLEDLTLTASVSAGTPADTVAQIDLFRDTNQDGVLDRSDVLLAAGTAPDGAGAVTFAGVNLAVPVDEAQFLLATVNVAAGATPGTTFAVGIVADADVTASSAFGNPLVTGAPLASRTMTVAGNLNVRAAETPVDAVVRNDDTGLVALDVEISATWETFRLRSLTVTAEGSMAPSVAVGGLALVAQEDGRRIAGGVTFPEGATRTVFAGLDEAVEPGTPRRFQVLMDLDGVATVDETIALSIAANVDVLAEGDSVGLSSPVGAPVLGPMLTVGRSLELAAGPMPPTDTIVAANAEGVAALSLSASAFNEDVTLSRLSLSAAGSLDDTSGIDAVHLFLDADGNGRIDPGDIEVAPAARVAGDDGKVTFGPIAEQITRNTTKHFLVAIDLSGVGQAGEEVTLSLAADSDVSAFGALSGAVAGSGAPVAGARISLVGALNVRVGAASPAGRGVRAEETFVALQAEVFTRGETVSIEQLALSVSGTADDAAAISMIRLYVDGDGNGEVGEADQLLANAPVDGDDGRAVLSSLGLTVASDDSAALIFEVEIAAGAEPGGTIRASIESNDDIRATGATTGDLTTVGAPVVGSSFTVVPPPREPPKQATEEGGCGCSTSSDRGGSAAWLAVFGLFFLRRRKTI